MTRGCRLHFTEFPKGCWRDQRVWIVGGGTSLANFDFSRLPRGEVTIGANQSAFSANTDVLFTLDQQFARMRRSKIGEFARTPGKMAVLAMPSNEDGHTPIEGATYMVRRRNPGFSRDPRDIYGMNSGYGAMNLAYLGDASEICLLGFDFCSAKDGETHFHGGYPWGDKRRQYYPVWSKEFEFAQQQLKEEGVKVVNYVGDPESVIEFFEKRPLDEI